jgi:hypothetical protein
MDLDDVASIVEGMAGVRRSGPVARPAWRYDGRLVARTLDEEHVVIRTELDARDRLLARHPATFHVPTRFAKHMMVVAYLPLADAGGVEDALVAAWDLQRRHG